MTERTAEIIGISWIVGFIGTGALLYLGIIPAKHFPVLYLVFAAPVVVLLFISLVFAMADPDDDPDDDEAFLSYAYRTLPCNIFNEEYEGRQEEEDEDGWQAGGEDEE